MKLKRWEKSGLTVESLTGPDITAAIDAVASLRIAVFRDFPYLYDGDMAYERGYLETFSKAAGAIVVIAKDGTRIVGASTGAPLAEVEEDWSAPFEAAGRDIDTLFYCAESVLLSDYRGLGLGHAFFEEREEHARQSEFSHVCFCSVIRPQDHLLRPEHYRSNDAFWSGRGYAPLNGMTARFSWKDIGEAAETSKTLQFWERAL